MYSGWQMARELPLQVWIQTRDLKRDGALAGWREFYPRPLPRSHSLPCRGDVRLDLIRFHHWFRLEESYFFQLGERVAKLLLSVHHDRSVPRDRLLERFAGNKEEANSVVASLNDDFVAAIKEHERA